MNAATQLTPGNYDRGFLIDQEWMASVVAESQDQFTAIIVDHQSAQTVLTKSFQSLAHAIREINSIERQWTFESSSGCDPRDCEKGACTQCGLCD